MDDKQIQSIKSIMKGSRLKLCYGTSSVYIKKLRVNVRHWL